MTGHRLINIGLAFTIAATLCAGALLDGPTLAQSEADTAADLAAAQAQARARALAEASCGGNVARCRPAHVRAAERLKAERVATK